MVPSPSKLIIYISLANLPTRFVPDAHLFDGSRYRLQDTYGECRVVGVLAHQLACPKASLLRKYAQGYVSGSLHLIYRS